MAAVEGEVGEELGIGAAVAAAAADEADLAGDEMAEEGCLPLGVKAFDARRGAEAGEDESRFRHAPVVAGLERGEDGQRIGCVEQARLPGVSEGVYANCVKNARGECGHG
jgi:hypothetical protein